MLWFWLFLQVDSDDLLGWLGLRAARTRCRFCLDIYIDDFWGFGLGNRRWWHVRALRAARTGRARLGRRGQDELRHWVRHRLVLRDHLRGWSRYRRGHFDNFRLRGRSLHVLGWPRLRRIRRQINNLLDILYVAPLEVVLIDEGHHRLVRLTWEYFYVDAALEPGLEALDLDFGHIVQMHRWAVGLADENIDAVLCFAVDVLYNGFF